MLTGPKGVKIEASNERLPYGIVEIILMDPSQLIPMEHYQTATDAVRQRTDQSPTIGLILGSGLGDLVNEINNPDAIPYSELPHWPRSTVLGHAGKLVIGQLGGQTILTLQGRAHFYEGYSMAQITLPVRVMKLLGIHTLVLTNAAGGLNPAFSAGDIMVIEDHIFPAGMTGYNPLRGPNLGSFGPRFPINTRIYDPELRALAHQIADENGLELRRGVYMSLSGPTFETPAEVRMLRAWGGDAVGMSTAPEAAVACHAGMRVLGFSMISNMAFDSTETVEEVSHEEVLRMGEQTVPHLMSVIRGVLEQLPPYDPARSENHPET